MRETLRFKPEIVAKVNAVYDSIALSMGTPRRDLFFVAMHNRRTDYVEYNREVHGQGPLIPEYFSVAMEAFRTRHENCAFIYVSDDMDWGRKNIIGEDIFFAGSGDSYSEDSIGVDLALLASANATVQGQGTFSMFGTILAGGECFNGRDFITQ